MSSKYTENDLQNLIAICSQNQESPQRTLLERCEKALAYRDVRLRLTRRDKEFLRTMYDDGMDPDAKETLRKILGEGRPVKDENVIRKKEELKIRPECLDCVSRSGDTPETASCTLGHKATCYRKKKPCPDHTPEKPAPAVPKPEKAIAYTDGSYNKAAGIWGYGAIILAGDEKYELSGSGKDTNGGWQIEGEITGALKACEKAAELGCKSLEIRYDYEGIACWATGSWRTNKPYTAAYAAKMRKYMAQMDIVFTHVKAHTGVEGNEAVDILAKKACGIYTPPAANGHKPSIPPDVNPKCRAAIEAFYKKAAVKFGDYIKLKTFGLDPYSGKSPAELDAFADEKGISGEVREVLGSGKEFYSCIRWVLRGLCTGDAIRKVQVDAEVAANYNRR